jgi:hypothetical protein
MMESRRGRPRPIIYVDRIGLDIRLMRVAAQRRRSRFHSARFVNILSIRTVLWKGFMATPINAPMAGEIWHLSIEDLFQPVQEAPRLGGDGPFVINLSASTAPISMPTQAFTGCSDTHVYQIQVTEDGRTRYRLRLGPFATEDEADAILTVARDTYPGALTATAGASDLRAIGSIQAKVDSRQSAARKPTDTVVTGKPAPKKAAAENRAAEKPAKVKADAEISIDMAWPELDIPQPVSREANWVAKAAPVLTEVVAPPIKVPAPKIPPAPTPVAAPVLTEAVVPKGKAPAPRFVAPVAAVPSARAPVVVTPVPVQIAPASLELAAKQAAAKQAAAKQAAERQAAEKRAAEKQAAEKQAAEKRAAEKQAAEKQAADKQAAEKRAAEKQAAEKQAAEKQAAEKQAAERHAAERQAAERQAAERQAAERQAAERQAAEKQAAERQAAAKQAAALAKPSLPKITLPMIAAPPAAEKRAPVLTQSLLSLSKAAAAKLRHSAMKPSASRLTSLQHVVVATAPAPAVRHVKQLDEPLESLESTQTMRALTPTELEDDEASRWFVIQLALADEAFDPDAVPNLDIFSEYRLYSVAGIDQGRIVHALRLGFFREEIGAVAVTSYLAAYWDKPTIKRVSLAERERFADQRVEARKDIGATGRHAVIEITDELVARRRRPSKSSASAKT